MSAPVPGERRVTTRRVRDLGYNPECRTVNRGDSPPSAGPETSEEAPPCPFALPVRLEHGYLLDAKGERVLYVGGPYGWLPEERVAWICAAINERAQR